MRTRDENWLLGHWYGLHAPPWYLRMLEPLYLSAFRRDQKKQAARLSKTEHSLPLIVVGNITAGGSGKTPLIIRLCQLAQGLGYRPGIASTGYGRQSLETVHVLTDSDTNQCGDEPVLLAQRAAAPVVVAAKRLDAVNVLNEMDIDLIFSDDGLQHADLDPDIEICVVDGSRGLGNGHLIPAGPLREPADRLQHVDYVVSNGDWRDKPAGLSINTMSLEPMAAKSLAHAGECPLVDFQEQYGRNGIHAFAGIGNPARFFDMLTSLGLSVKPHALADHHRLSRRDFESVNDGAAILMTEKDAVKSHSLGLTNAWYVPVETRLTDEFESILRADFSKLIEKNQT